MSISKVLFSSKSVEWPTPVAFFKQLNDEFNFTLDPCATHENATCDRYYTVKEDGLAQNWGKERVFCNPPYGRHVAGWARKCFEASNNGALVVLLIPARTDTRWFHQWVLGKADIRFVKGRLKFGDGKNAAPFSSIVAIFHPFGSMAQQAANDNRSMIAA